MVRTNQGGSVLSFIIIGVVLAGLLVGGVYIIRQQLAVFEPTQPQEPTRQPETTQQPQKPEEHETPPNSTAPQTNQSMPASGSPAGTLPQTGPAEVVSALVAIGLSSGVILSYLRSRRPELSL